MRRAGGGSSKTGRLPLPGGVFPGRRGRIGEPAVLIEVVTETAGPEPPERVEHAGDQQRRGEAHEHRQRGVPAGEPLEGLHAAGAEAVEQRAEQGAIMSEPEPAISGPLSEGGVAADQPPPVAHAEALEANAVVAQFQP